MQRSLCSIVFSQVENRVAELADTRRVLVVASVDGSRPMAIWWARPSPWAL